MRIHGWEEKAEPVGRIDYTGCNRRNFICRNQASSSAGCAGGGNVSKKLVYTMEVARADEELTKMVKPGDVVNVGVSGLEQSVVKNVEIEPGEQVLFDKENGRYVKVEIPDKYRMMVTLEGDAAVTPMSIGIGETPVRVGTEFVAKGKGYALVGYVLQSDLQ